MIAPETLTALEFDRIREIVKALAVSALGEERLKTLAPFDRMEEAEHWLMLTGEIVRLLREATGGFPIYGLTDIREELKRAAVEGVALEPESLLKIGNTAHVSREMKQYLRSRKSAAPLLFSLSETMTSFEEIEKRITDTVETDGTIKDDASHELKHIRQAIHKEEKHLEAKLQKILSKWSASGALQEEVISYRSGKLVLPVREEMRGRVQGMIVDQSSSGQTVFMEPVETLEISNKVRQLEIDEKKEIHRILQEITALIRAALPDLTNTLETLAELDELYARGRLALRWDSVEPEFTSKGEVRIWKGRHPLLLDRLKNAVVPLTIEITPPVRTIVISGPNAGGKTVALKTVGLFCAMAAAGLFVPAAPGSELPFFAGIHADIGDAQSIESDLSTFTAHIGKLRRLVIDPSRPKLILVDEIGSSTDPAVGAALAQAILLELTRQEAVSLVTTHHGGLKAFAHETEGMENGSMAFDEQSLTPTYVYRSGVPGSSYALEIAARVGFPKSLLEHAQSFLGKGLMGLEELVGDLSRKIEDYEKLRRQSDLKLNEYAALQKLYEERVSELKKVKAETKKKALAEAEYLMLHASREFEAAIKEVKEGAASSAAIKAARERIAVVKGEVEKTQKEAEKTLAPPQPERVKLEKAAVGDRVEIEDMNGVGKVVSIQKHGKRAEIEIGGVRLWVDANRLFAAPEEKKGKLKRVEMTVELNTPWVPTKLDLRGKYGEEALPEIDSYLASAAELNYKEVSLIHGKGTGALRVKVREFLDTHPLVKSYHDGGPNSDDFGCTVVELK
jgi:DNA mismatch repair protein MutS2